MKTNKTGNVNEIYADGDDGGHVNYKHNLVSPTKHDDERCLKMIEVLTATNETSLGNDDGDRNDEYSTPVLPAAVFGELKMELKSTRVRMDDEHDDAESKSALDSSSMMLNVFTGT